MRFRKKADSFIYVCFASSKISNSCSEVSLSVCDFYFALFRRSSEPSKYPVEGLEERGSYDQTMVNKMFKWDGNQKIGLIFFYRD